MSSLQTLTRRVEALEARLADVESGYGQSLYRLRRHAVRNELAMKKVLDHLGIAEPTEDEIDIILDES